jgi:hypothetical protein
MTDLVEGSHAARSTLGGSPFPPIADYGFLSDREVSALVAPGGNVGPWRHGSTRSETHQRAPVDHSAERGLLRTAFLPPEDKRVRSTVLAIADELTENELVLRYHVEETDDGFSGEEGTFTICSFWLVSALTEIGEVARARALCEKLLSYASPLLLYAEEIDPHSGRHLGNFPQAFSHLALINAVIHLIRADEMDQSSFPGAIIAGGEHEGSLSVPGIPRSQGHRAERAGDLPA